MSKGVMWGSRDPIL